MPCLLCRLKLSLADGGKGVGVSISFYEIISNTFLLFFFSSICDLKEEIAGRNLRLTFVRNTCGVECQSVLRLAGPSGKIAFKRK